ncbi:hypothetical protein TorRG33x02_298110 [Trema orientale]|uniref:Uncharacterized protein n=1 Tax=Trema orientale TaxID=63057 RepID=A0A2P5C4I7_TREOI|nr:hypothetical protein TorRG33x02_298110 [Trema orientale]
MNLNEKSLLLDIDSSSGELPCHAMTFGKTIISIFC